MKGWLETLWEQVFAETLIIPVARFLWANLTLGLFALIVLHAGARMPERTNPVFTALVAIAAVTHLGGCLVAAVVDRARARILFIQGGSLSLATAGLVTMSTWLTLRAPALSNVRYVPGVACMLFIYATLELHFFGPRRVQALGVRKLGIGIGVASELIMAAALAWRLLTR